MSQRWRIYYEDGESVSGTTVTDWRQAPRRGVQVILIFEPLANSPQEWRIENLPDIAATGYVHRGWNRHYQLYTGVDDYDPLDFGPGTIKQGSLIPDGLYDAIWAEALATAEIWHRQETGRE